MAYEIRDDVRAEVEEYLASANADQAAIQEMRRHLAYFKLGRQACTQYEEELVKVVFSADRVLKEKLSVTLINNRRR